LRLNQQITKLIAHTPFSAWRVVSTYLRLNPPWCGDSRLLVIPFSCSRISGYNPFYIQFWRLAQIRIFASLCKGICGTSIAHNIKVMMTCLSPCYHIRYTGELLYLPLNSRWKKKMGFFFKLFFWKIGLFSKFFQWKPRKATTNKI